MLSISAQNIFKRFSFDWIIKDFNHEFDPLSITGISGRNGSGKTTLIRMIAGFMINSKGKFDYSINSEAIAHDQLYKYLSFSAPYLELFEELTAGEIFDLVSSMKDYGVSKSEFLLNCYLDHEKSKFVKYFSSGMKQRLSLALAIMCNSQLLILDEPSSYLDDEAKKWFSDLLEQHSEGKTIIIASNENADFKLCNEFIAL